MGFSTAFKPAGKYAGYSGFSPGISLGESLTTPLSQQTGSVNSSPPDLAAVYDSYGPNIPEDLKKDLLRQEMLNRSSNKIGEDDTLLKILDKFSDPKRQKETLDQQLAYDKARMKEAFPYLMAREIPRQISEGFGAQAALNVLGARSTVDAMNQTLQAYPSMSFASVPYQGSQKYFS